MGTLKVTIISAWHNPAWRAAVLGTLLARVLLGLWAYLIILLFPLAVQNVIIRGEALVSIFDLRTSAGHTYNREVNGKRLDFAQVDAQLLDAQTNSQWDPATGLALAGPLKGTRLSAAQTPPADLYPYMGATPHPNPLLGIWQHFDANWYITIAQRGYGFFPDDTHFGPLYPLLVRGAYFIWPDWLLAGLSVSTLATLLLLKNFYELTAAWSNHALAQRSLLLYLIFPSAFFLFSAYAEPLFILTTLLALKEMRAQRWLSGGLWTACALLTRIQGAGLLLPLAFALWKSDGLRPGMNHVKALGPPALALLGYIALRIAAGAPSALPISEPSVGAGLVWPWDNFGAAFAMIFSGEASYITYVNLSLAVLFIALLIPAWKKIPLEYSLCWLAYLLILFSRTVISQPLNPMIRYALTIPMAFFILAQASQNPWINRLLFITFLLFGLFMSAQFFMWGFIA